MFTLSPRVSTQALAKMQAQGGRQQTLGWNQVHNVRPANLWEQIICSLLPQMDNFVLEVVYVWPLQMFRGHNCGASRSLVLKLQFWSSMWSAHPSRLMSHCQTSLVFHAVVMIHVWCATYGHRVTMCCTPTTCLWTLPN